jgi:AraC-like DNA-binding protein
VTNARAIFDPRVRVVADFVREHISDPERLSLAAAARLANVSPEHFCRVFRARTGLSFNEWQCAYRMEYAKGLILDRWMPIGVVGVAVGYGHASTFARVFKRYEGVSPRELRAFATAYPELVNALRTGNSRLVFRVGPLVSRNCRALPLLERIAQRLRQAAHSGPGLGP